MWGMATEETDGRDDESRESRAHTVGLSERTVRIDHLRPAELRCGITLRGGAEPEEPHQSSTVDEESE